MTEPRFGHRLISKMAPWKSNIEDVRQNLHDAAAKAKAHAHDMKVELKCVDLKIQFIGASGLPKMDVVGTADPFFTADIDGQIKYISEVKANTLSPVWNEVWNVKNVPITAMLHVAVMDKDNGPTDDTIGGFQITVSPGAKEAEIEGSVLKRAKGTFWLKIDVKEPADTKVPQYTFDGPIRFSRHFSPTVGRLTSVNDERLYSTWKMYLKGVPLIFGDFQQPWNHSYQAAQTIFGTGPSSFAVRSGIQAGHKMLYARRTTNGFGTIESAADVHHILQGGRNPNSPVAAASPATAHHRVKPAVYTYVIAVEDSSFRFSETGAAFFVDFASKHALHSNCAETVRYSGEFHPRPKGGWQNFSDETPDESVDWELVIDNNSGTYSPDKAMLPKLKQLLEYNFPGFAIYALDHEDPQLKESREACRNYALQYRAVKKEELQPHLKEGEETLMHHASVKGEQVESDAAEVPGINS